MQLRKLVASVFIGLVAAAVAPPAGAGAATTVGMTAPPAGATCIRGTLLQSVSVGNTHVVPSAGVLTSWSHLAPGGDNSAADRMKLKVARPVTADSWLIVGESQWEAITDGTVNTFPTRIPVQAGDVLGLIGENDEGLLFDCAARDPAFSIDYPKDDIGADVPPGDTRTYIRQPDFILDISASLESDFDGDGFGDETQDSDDDADGVADVSDNCPLTPNADQLDSDGDGQGNACDASPEPQPLPDTDAPDTTITKEPKSKSSKPSAKYKFVSDESGSTFECKIDKKPFKPCASPKKFKVKDGKHKFLVRAIDPAGNVDPTADKDNFKVVD